VFFTQIDVPDIIVWANAATVLSAFL
jgi:hypothetical protein